MWGEKKKFFVNNAIEALIPFKKDHQGLLKLHKKKVELYSKEGIFFETKQWRMRRLFRTY